MAKLQFPNCKYAKIKNFIYESVNFLNLILVSSF